MQYPVVDGGGDKQSSLDIFYFLFFLWNLCYDLGKNPFLSQKLTHIYSHRMISVKNSFTSSKTLFFKYDIHSYLDSLISAILYFLTYKNG